MPNWNLCFLPPDVAKSVSYWLSQFSFLKLRQPTEQRLSNNRVQQTKMRPIVFLYYEESLVSSNLNSKQFLFPGMANSCEGYTFYICPVSTVISLFIFAMEYTRISTFLENSFLGCHLLNLNLEKGTARIIPMLIHTFRKI